MNDATLILISAASVFLGLLSALLFGFWLRLPKWWQKAMVKAPVYGLFLGFGILGGGTSEPGFALPVPVIPAFFLSEKSDSIYSAVLPFLIWTLVFFVYESVKYGLYNIKAQRALKARQAADSTRHDS